MIPQSPADAAAAKWLASNRAAIVATHDAKARAAAQKTLDATLARMRAAKPVVPPPVGLKAVRCHTNVVVKDDGKGDRSERLLRSAGKYCVVLSTLRSGVPVDATFELSRAVP